MNPAPLLDAATARVLGFDWLATAVAPVSPYGQRRFAELRPFAPGEEDAAAAARAHDRRDRFGARRAAH